MVNLVYKEWTIIISCYTLQLMKILLVEYISIIIVNLNIYP